MIELCSKKRMLLSIAGLGLVSILIIILESKHLRAHEVDIHERYATGSVADSDPRVFWLPGSGSISEKYGSGSFYH